MGWGEEQAEIPEAATKDSRLLEALVRLSKICASFDLDLMAQRTVKEKALAETICDFASKVSECQPKIYI